MKYFVSLTTIIFVSFCSAQLKASPNCQKLSFLVWNIHKAQSKEWATDFNELLAKKVDFLLIQEAVTQDHFNRVVLPYFSFHRYYNSWGQGKRATGLYSGSQIKPIQAKGCRSRVREPIVNTPKMISKEIFDICGTSLLVINIHAINFVSTSKYIMQIESLREVLSDHHGPIFFAGDFNTWNKNRKNYLDQFTQSFGLREVRFERNEKYLMLDHAFTRGMEILSAHQSASSGSDHDPIRIDVRL